MTIGVGSGAAAGGAAAAGAATSQAIKAPGAIVRAEPEEFLRILRKSQAPLVVYAPARFLVRHRYLTSYKGLIFFAQAKEWLELDDEIEVITAKSIWAPQ